MYHRVLAILLAIVVAVGMGMPTVSASPDVAGLVDDGAPDPEPAVVVARVAPVLPARHELRQIVTPRIEPAGRRHPVLVFRPPRLVASR
jgi:hypothetical protein